MVAQMQWRRPADQLQELISRIDRLEEAIDALVADRKWIVAALADRAFEVEVGS